MPPLPQALLAVVILSVTIAVTAAPATDGKVVLSKSSSLKEQAKSLTDKKKLRRGKRQVVFEDVISPNDDDDEFTEEAAIRQQLQQLSDEELAALADIVREEMIRYEQPPQLVAMPQYEIIDVPDEMLDSQVYEPFPRDRRAVAPMGWGEINDEPEYVVVPEEAVIEALNEERDEQELRERIAEIAQILNERANRRSRLY
uniref:Secreted protein n=1 Tax=Haemonchus contortus TaxID=6289 RepID=A0A7I4XY66_HAECO